MTMATAVPVVWVEWVAWVVSNPLAYRKGPCGGLFAGFALTRGPYPVDRAAKTGQMCPAFRKGRAGWGVAKW